MTADRRIAIVFNGEIFNYRTLRDGLAAKGVRFETNSEIETLLQLYVHEGAAMMRRMSARASSVRDSRYMSSARL